ncbi:hypothetical protein FG379_001900 [Cryptosporidium bovis]|uniref:uncharacterized protein n=1 Tax=Cryptosporidium bovis TaxID=310047 RepID=UPI003519F24D|nr:hypothetical protein FG379_001900 [Cryptosporidium bovis]
MGVKYERSAILPNKVIISKNILYLLLFGLIFLALGSEQAGNSGAISSNSSSTLAQEWGFDDESDDDKEIKEVSNSENKYENDHEDNEDEEHEENNDHDGENDERTINNDMNDSDIIRNRTQHDDNANSSAKSDIDIIKRKISNHTQKDDFFAREVYTKLFELFEPASDKKINFLEINKNLTNLIDNSNSKANVGDSYGVLTYLWFYGIPDKDGKLEFPYGWPRNIDISIRYAIKGATKYRCGFCYTAIGMLFAWGYPPLVNNTHGWLGIDGAESNIDDINTSFKNIYFLYQSSHKYGNYMDNDTINLPKERSGFDLVAMNYALASKNKDIFGQLANSYYLRYGLSDLSYIYTDIEKSSSFSLHRSPYNLTSQVGTPSSSSRCIMALEPLIYVASKTLNDNSDLFLPEIKTILREKKPKEHETKHYAEWVRSLAADRDPDGLTSLGELYYYGHEAGGIARDINRAAQLWEESARRGDPQGALARAFLNLDGTIGTESDSAPYLRQVSRYGEPAASALANYYIYKLGLDVKKNSTIAGEYLKLAADLGDGNAQLILAHAYAGGKMGVVPPGGQNETLALKYYKLSAEGGRTVAYFNSAVLTLKGSDRKYKTEESRCIASVDYLTYVVKKNNHVKLLGLLSRKSYDNGDIVGSLLREMTLSEIGIMESHINARDLWKERSLALFAEGFNYLDSNKYQSNSTLLSEKITSKSSTLSSFNSITLNRHNNIYEDLTFVLKNYYLNSECNIEIDENVNISTFYPSILDMRLSGYSSNSYCYVNLTRNNVFSNIPIYFDNSLNTIGSFNFKYFDPFGSLNATKRGEMDVMYTLKQSNSDKLRVSEFLYCWMRPESHYKIGNGNINNDDDIKNSRYINNLLYMWIKPHNGSYRRYPKPWYKSLRTLINIFKKIFGKINIKYIYDLNILSSKFKYLEDDLELEKSVPEKYHLLRNSSLWCSHYYAKRSSSNGDIYSTHSLSHHYLEGSHGAIKSNKLAFRYIMQGVNSRDPKSILDYAIALYNGIGIKKDKHRSYRLLWHIIFRGPYDVEEILPKIPKGPKFIPSILDTIREAIVPLMKNNTNSTSENSINNSTLAEELFNSNKSSAPDLVSNSIENDNNLSDDGNNHGYLTDNSEEDEDDEYDDDDDIVTEFGSRFGIKVKSKIPSKNKRARHNDSLNNMIRTQNDFIARISSLNILFLFTLDWIIYNYIYYFYNSSLELKSSIYDLFSSIMHYRNETEADNNTNINNEDVNESNNYSINVQLFIDKSNLFGFISNKTYHDRLQINNIDNKDKSNDNENAGHKYYEEDPFPLSSRFRYISDEEYLKASNIWRASIPTRIYYFILRVVFVILLISILIPVNITITEKMNS